MARKRWTSKTEITPSLLIFREKRKWQINLRRYVLKKSPCPAYATYFGLDIEKMRQWFECQFPSEIGWADFGTKWQFDHIIPVTYFDFSREAELRLCWNFTNLRIEKLKLNKDRGHRLDVLAARSYFRELYEKTKYPICLELLQKIDQLELSEFISTGSQQAFIRDHREYLDMIRNYTAFEFELLNSGRDIKEVLKEIDFLKKFR